MRILFVVQNYPPERGPVRYTYDLAVRLALAGQDVTVLTALPNYPLGRCYRGFGRFRPDIRQESGVRVVRVPALMASNRQVVRRVIGFLTFALSAMPWALLTQKPDVVIASIPPITVAGLGVLCSLIRRRPLVILARDIEPLTSLELRGLEKSLVGRCLIILSRILYRRARRIVTIHSGQVERLRELSIPVERIVTIPHGVDVTEMSDRPEVAEKVSIPRREGCYLLLYLGTIGRCHDLESFIKTAADRRIRSLPLDIVLIGDGECANNCMKLINRDKLENIRIMQPVPHECVPSILARGDILLCSYKRHREALLGSKFYEYCAAGKPILVYGESHASRLVEQIGNGIAVRTEDSDSLYCAMSSFLSDIALWRDRGQLGAEYAQKHFSFESRIRAWTSALDLMSERE